MSRAVCCNSFSVEPCDARPGHSPVSTKSQSMWWNTPDSRMRDPHNWSLPHITRMGDWYHAIMVTVRSWSLVMRHQPTSAWSRAPQCRHQRRLSSVMSKPHFWLFVSYSRMKHSPRSRFHNFIRVLFAFLSPDNINKVQTVQTWARAAWRHHQVCTTQQDWLINTNVGKIIVSWPSVAPLSLSAGGGVTSHSWAWGCLVTGLWAPGEVLAYLHSLHSSDGK